MSFQRDPASSLMPKTEDPARELQGSEGLLLSSLTLIWRVIYGRRYALADADAPDVAQEAALRLWKWREKFCDKGKQMTIAEWDSFTAKTAHNEINRHFSNQSRTNEVPLDEADLLQTRTPEGDADAEMFSLTKDVWQAICRLSLYQRRALLLNSAELLIYFMKFGVREASIVASLEINEEDWPDISGRLPLSDREIAAIARSQKKPCDPEAAALAIKKARFDARQKLRRFRK